MLALNLAPIFKARGIDKPTTFLQNVGFSAHVAFNFINKKTSSITLEQIEKLCIALFCEPNDLFVFSADSKQKLSDDHSMKHFSNQETPKQNFQDIVSTVPLKQLKELTKNLAEKNNI